MSLWGGVDVYTPMCMHTTHGSWASTHQKQLFLSSKTNPQHSSEVIAVRQSKGQFKSVTPSEHGIPLSKGHLERRYESDSILELNQKAKQLIYYAVTLQWPHPQHMQLLLASVGVMNTDEEKVLLWQGNTSETFLWLTFKKPACIFQSLFINTNKVLCGTLKYVLLFPSGHF